MNFSQTELANLAEKAQSFSYSPYSNKKIGAAVLLTNGQVYTGANIENASYGGTVCAERVAILKAYSENDPKAVKVQAVAVISDSEVPWPPCGLCRQVIAEFCTQQTEIILASNKNAKLVTHKFSELFPSGFGPEFL